MTGRILVVDDEENILNLVRMYLERDGFTVLEAEDGRAALVSIREKKPDLVVLDIVMPEMDGLEAMTRILRKHRKIPIILNTSYVSYQEDFMTWAADAYVVKSSDFTELKKTIKELISTAE